MKKSQLQLGQPFIWISMIVFIAFLLIFSTKAINNIKTTAKQTEIKNFVISLRSALEEMSYNFGSVKELALSLPIDVSSVCFVDSSKKINPLINNKLNIQINKFPDKNLFLSPSSESYPYHIGYIKLQENENPLCIKTVNGKIRLKLTGRGNTTSVTASNPSDKEVDCVSLLYNGDPNDKVDIVFLAYNYDKTEDFTSEVNDYINNVFLKTEPFKSNKKKINFYMIDEFVDMGCDIKGYLDCNEFKVKQLASQCPNDYIFVLGKRNKALDLLSPVRSSAYSNIAHINTADNKKVLLHEFGHVFGGLADEYVDENYYAGFNAAQYPNCDLNDKCPEKWKNLSARCFIGCSTNKFSRGTKTSIMRDFTKTDSYGVVDENIIKKLLTGFYK